jgi:hypothetical protein
MDLFALIAYLWFLHLYVAFPVSLPFWFFGRRPLSGSNGNLLFLSCRSRYG